MTRMGATTPDEGTMALTQHLPHHNKHLLVWGLWVLQQDNEGQGKDRDNDHNHNHNHNEDSEGKGTMAG